MEPIITIVHILTFFCGYYIGTDFYNYYKSQSNHYEQIKILNSIESRVSNIETKIK